MGFMLVYYRFSGIIADISLLCYVALLLGLVSVFKATLTLPGIAALIMSVGMAVDGNVIIFERIKEELKKGKTLMSSIEAGFRRSYAPILDSQITTLIASAVLFYFGTGSVRGFAVMLALGTAISIFTAITVTHILFQLFSQLKIMKSPKTFGI
jgi:protein-export membrane protein SecD